MFALNEGYQWKSSNFAESLHGVVYLPAFNHRERISRNALGDFSWQILDPQLYLARLDCAKCTKVCSRLATYPWFGVNGLPDFDSGNTSMTKWQASVQGVIGQKWPGAEPSGAAVLAAARSAVEFQVACGCSHILLPTPLITEREDEAQLVGDWVDAGLEAVSDLDVGQPVIATVALSEVVLNAQAFSRGGFLDTIVDQVMSRDGVSGAYIVVGQLQSGHPLYTSEAVLRAYSYLTSAFVAGGSEFVLVNFADSFGVACVGLGASGFATGPTQSLRRLSLAGFLDDGGGLPLPRCYSHPALAEFLPERELEVLAQKGLLALVQDRTVYSGDLFDSLGESASADSVAAWIESRNNVAAAGKHFIARMIKEGRQYARLTPLQRAERAMRWLGNAVSVQEQIAEALSSVDTQPTLADANTWIDVYRRHR